MTTNAARILEKLGISFEIVRYEVQVDDLSAETAARLIGAPPETVFKTLVARGDRTGVLLAVVPGPDELDLKALARASGDRRVTLVPLKEVQPLTGYVRGAVTALGLRRKYPVFVDASAENIPRIGVSGGLRGVELLLEPRDYLRATQGRIAPIARRHQK